MLLTRQEYLLWEKTKDAKKFSHNFLNNLNDPAIVAEIRKIIHPPIWKPAGITKHFLKTLSISPSEKDTFP